MEFAASAFPRRIAGSPLGAIPRPDLRRAGARHLEYCRPGTEEPEPELPADALRGGRPKRSSNLVRCHLRRDRGARGYPEACAPSGAAFPEARGSGGHRPPSTLLRCGHIRPIRRGGPDPLPRQYLDPPGCFHHGRPVDATQSGLPVSSWPPGTSLRAYQWQRRIPGDSRRPRPSGCHAGRVVSGVLSLHWGSLQVDGYRLRGPAPGPRPSRQPDQLRPEKPRRPPHPTLRRRPGVRCAPSQPRPGDQGSHQGGTDPPCGVPWMRSQPF